MNTKFRDLAVAVCVNLLVFVGLVVLIEVAATIAFAVKDVDELWLSSDTVDSPCLYFSYQPRSDSNWSVNADGMATEYPKQKPKNMYRVAILGGSVARSSFASDKSKTISAILEKLLREHFSTKKIEVINAGMSAYVLEQDFIFYQLYLSKYRPDLIVGLDGYNDLMAVSFNRYNGNLIGPQNYEQFLVIHEGKTRKTLFGKITALVPSTIRVVNFIKRTMLKQSRYDYSTLDADYVQRAATQYVELIEDLGRLAEQRGALYVPFLQPIRWYHPVELTKPKDAIPELVGLYQAYEEFFHTLPHAHSLTTLLLEREELYVDSTVHVGDEGNSLFARAIFKRIELLVRAGISGLVVNPEEQATAYGHKSPQA